MTKPYSHLVGGFETETTGQAPSFAPVRSVLRAFDVLSLLGEFGALKVSQIGKALSLPEPTVVRLLETLMVAGYIAKDHEQSQYRVSPKVYRLCGFHNASLIVDASRPALLQLTKELKWPVSVAVLDYDAMVILYSTMVVSPFSWKPTGNRLPMLTRAMGLAYFAFCSNAHRTLLERILRTSNLLENRFQGSALQLAELVTKVRAAGYAERDRGREPKSQTTIAVPVIAHGEVRCTIGLTYYEAAMTRKEAAERFLPSMQNAATKVGGELEAAISDQT